MKKVMFSLPDNLASRLRAAIPSRERSKVAAALFEIEISAREKSFSRSVKTGIGLKKEMWRWETECSSGGFVVHSMQKK